MVETREGKRRAPLDGANGRAISGWSAGAWLRPRATQRACPVTRSVNRRLGCLPSIALRW